MGNAFKTYSNSGGRNIGLTMMLDEIVEQINEEAKSRGARALTELRNAELNVLRGQRSGKVYRKPNTKKATYTASAPGEPPARRSGNLRLHWKGEVKGKIKSGNSLEISIELKSDHNYSVWLEDGTEKMAARPYKDKIIETALPKIKAIYEEPY